LWTVKFWFVHERKTILLALILALASRVTNHTAEVTAAAFLLEYVAG